MGSRPLRMKVRWGCPPRVLSPPLPRTQSWRPCLPGQPWASGWRSTDRPVPSPRGWTIGFSERGAAHNRALPRCLSSRRCMRSWRVRGWPISWPEAACPPPPSSLPSTAEWPGGTRAFPRWRERLRCTCAHETPPLGGTVRVSRQPSSILLGRICPRVQSYVVLPQAWASPYQCLHMLPPFGQDVASTAPFYGRLASLPLRQDVTTNRKDLKLSFTEGRNPFRFRGERNSGLAISSSDVLSGPGGHQG